MSAQACIDAIKKAVGDDLTDDQLTEIFELLERKAARKRAADPLLSAERSLIDAAEELANESKLESLIEKRNRYFAVLRKQQRQARIEQFNGDYRKAISAMNVGREGNVYGAGNSVDAIGKGVEAELRGALFARLRRDGLLEVAKTRDPLFEQRVATEMARLNGSKVARSTGDKNAESLAKAFNDTLEAARLLQNEAGAFIRKLPGYIVRQGHDMYKIRNTPREQWVADMKQWLDPATFNANQTADEFLNQVYANLSSGVHLSMGDSDWLSGFKGPGNLAKKLSQERTLHFKDPETWMAYNQKYGVGSLYDAVNGHIDKAAKSTALLRVWGPNPESAFAAEIDQALIRLRDEGRYEDAEALASASRNGMLKAEFDQLTGASNIPGSVKIAWWGSVTRMVITMSKLGGMTLSAFPDIHVRAAALRHNGVNMMEGYANAMQSLFGRFNKGESREVADLLNVGTQGMVGAIFERFSAADNLPGKAAKLQNLFFKLNLGTWWNDVMSRGVGLILSRNLGNYAIAGRAFGDFDARLQTTLRRYGIDEAEWNVLRQANAKAADGEHFLVADGLDDVSDEVIAGWLGKESAGPGELKRAREELKTRLNTYYQDQVSESMTVAGAKERAMTRQDIPPGTVWGEAIRFMMQFKQYPITFVSKHIGRELYRGDKKDWGGIASLIVGTTALGYVSMTAKDFVKGRTPRTPEDAGGWADLFYASMMQGGGLGIFTDFLFGEYNRFGGGLAETIAGPLVGTANDVIRVWHAAIRGEDFGATAFKTVLNNTPFINLFYARAAMDYLILYNIQEMMNPGYLRRYEQRIKRENNQEFILPPSEVVPTGGGF